MMAQACTYCGTPDPVCIDEGDKCCGFCEHLEPDERRKEASE